MNPEAACDLTLAPLSCWSCLPRTDWETHVSIPLRQVLRRWSNCRSYASPRICTRKQFCPSRDLDVDASIYLCPADLCVTTDPKATLWFSSSSVDSQCTSSSAYPGSQRDKHSSVPPKGHPLTLIQLQITREPCGQDPDPLSHEYPGAVLFIHEFNRKHTCLCPWSQACGSVLAMDPEAVLWLSSKPSQLQLGPIMPTQGPPSVISGVFPGTQCDPYPPTHLVTGLPSADPEVDI